MLGKWYRLPASAINVTRAFVACSAPAMTARSRTAQRVGQTMGTKTYKSVQAVKLANIYVR